MQKQRVMVVGSNSALAQTFMKQYKDSYDFVKVDKSGEAIDIIWDMAKDSFDTKIDVDIVIHYAAIAGVRPCEENPLLASKVNCLGTLGLLEWAKNNEVKRFVYVSTAISGDEEMGVHIENHVKRPSTVYELTKSIAEDMVEYYQKYFQVSILRFFTPYGPNTKPGRLIHLLASRIHVGKPILLNNNSAPRLSPTYIDDLNEAIHNVLLKQETAYGMFNVCGSDVVNIEEIAVLIGKIFEKPVTFERTGKDAGDLVGSNAKLRKFYEPKTSLEEGLARTMRLMAAEGF